MLVVVKTTLYTCSYQQMMDLSNSDKIYSFTGTGFTVALMCDVLLLLEMLYIFSMLLGNV